MRLFGVVRELGRSPGLPLRVHHITQRGNERGEVFFSPDDRDVYLDLAGEQARVMHVWGQTAFSQKARKGVSPRSASHITQRGNEGCDFAHSMTAKPGLQRVV